uniref:ShKT domain-containing protein n=1 Tax=Steinernema glaseri TaxID=37863 RepID=A0A1I7Y6W0_9BILA
MLRTFLVLLPFVCLLTLADDSPTGGTTCVDSDAKCPAWASQGECQSNAVWMMANCRRSCQSCQGGDRAWKLRTHIAQSYDNSTSNGTKNVNIESVRLNHLEIDEAKQVVRVFGRMVLSWNDSKVSWEREQWGLSWLNFYWIQIWTPQLIQINAAAANPSTVTGKVLAANYTGQVYMWTDFAFSAPYHFQYERYPNDYQKICYKFDDKRYFSVRFSVSDEVKSRQHEAVGETHVSGWTVESLDISDSKYVLQILGDWRQNPFDVQTNNCEMCIGLRRNAVYYLAEMLLPALVSTALTLSSVFFHLTTTQGMLLAFSIVVQLLAMTLINARLPNFTTSTPTILKYAGFNLVMTALLFIVSLVLRRLCQSSSQIPPPHSVDVVLSVIDRFVPIPAPAKDAEDTTQGKYSGVAHTLNNLVFAISFLVYVIAITFSFVF